MRKLMNEALGRDFRCSDIVDSQMIFQWIKTGKVSRREFENWLADREEQCYSEAHETSVVGQRRAG